jgi:hypothetical protein
MISPQPEGMEVSVTAIRKSICSESIIHDMTRELSAGKHRFTTLKKSVVACLATIVGLALLVPRTASAEPPRSGPTTYKCQTVKETQCTAAPGGGGQLTNCHTVDVYSCTAVSGPGSAPNVGGGRPVPVRSPVAGPVWGGRQHSRRPHSGRECSCVIGERQTRQSGQQLGAHCIKCWSEGQAQLAIQPK